MCLLSQSDRRSGRYSQSMGYQPEPQHKEVGKNLRKLVAEMAGIAEIPIELHPVSETA